MPESAPSYLGSPPANQSVVTAQHQEEQSALRNQLAPGIMKTKAGGPHPREATSQEAHIPGGPQSREATSLRKHTSPKNSREMGSESWRQHTPKASDQKSFPKSSQALHSQTPRAASVIAMRPGSHRVTRGDCVWNLHTRRILCGSEAAALWKSRNSASI